MEKISCFLLGFFLFSLAAKGGESLSVERELYFKDQQKNPRLIWNNLLEKSITLEVEGKQEEIKISGILEDLFPRGCKKETVLNIISAWIEDYQRFKASNSSEKEKVFRMNSGGEPYFSYTKEGAYSIEDFKGDIKSLKEARTLEEFNDVYSRRVRRKIMAHGPCGGMLEAEEKDNEKRFNERLLFIEKVSPYLHSEMWNLLLQEFMEDKRETCPDSVKPNPEKKSSKLLQSPSFHSYFKKILRTIFCWSFLGIGEPTSRSFGNPKKRRFPSPFYRTFFPSSCPSRLFYNNSLFMTEKGSSHN